MESAGGDLLRQMEWTLQLSIGKNLKEQDIRNLRETLKYDIPPADMERCGDFNDLWNYLYGKALIRLGNYDYLAQRFHALELVQIVKQIEEAHELMRQMTCTYVAGQYENIIDGPTFYKQIEDLRIFKATVPDTTLDTFCYPNAAAAIAGEKDITLKLKDRFHLFVPKQSVESCDLVVYCHFDFLNSPGTESDLLQPHEEQNIIWYGIPITCGPTPHKFRPPVNLVLGHCADLPPHERIHCESLCIYMKRVQGEFEPLGSKPCIFDRTGFVTIQTDHFTSFCVGLDASKADCVPKIKISILASVRKSTNGGILLDIIFLLDTDHMVQMACRNSLTMKMEASFSQSNRVAILAKPDADLALVLKDGSPSKTRTVNIPQHVIRNLAFTPLLLTKSIIPPMGKQHACEVRLSQQEPITDFVILSDSYEMDVLPRRDCPWDVTSEVASSDTDNAEILASDSGISDQEQRLEDVGVLHAARHQRIGSKLLSQLLAESPGEITMLLSKEKTLIQELIMTPMEADGINLVLAVLSKMCQVETPEAVGDLARVLTVVQETAFIERVITTHLTHLQEIERLKREQFAKPIMDVLNLCFQLLHMFPRRDDTRHIVNRCLSTVQNVTQAPHPATYTIDRQISARIEHVAFLLNSQFSTCTFRNPKQFGWRHANTCRSPRSRRILYEEYESKILNMGIGRQSRLDYTRTKMGYTQLCLLLADDPNDILYTLYANMIELRDTIMTVDPLTQHYVRLILAVFSKACHCTISNQTLAHVLSLVHDTGFLDRTVPVYFLDMTKERSVQKQEKFGQAIKDALELCSQILLRIPSPDYDKVARCVFATEQTIARVLLPRTDIIDEDIEGKLKDAKSRLEKLLLSKKGRAIGPVGKTVLGKEAESAFRDGIQARGNTKEKDKMEQNFRTIPVAPRRKDLVLRSYDDGPYLCANKVSGRYINVDQYLDVQFHLLREDFVRPLREGLKEYLHHYVEMEHSNVRLQNVRVYNNIHIIRPVCTNDRLTYRIRLDSKQVTNVKWHISKRLIFGSLVCLSQDNFDTLLFGTVTDRRPECLKNDGELEIKFEEFSQDVAVAIRNMKFSYTMLETTAYFAAYKHILKGIQDTNEENMPFKRYLVDCEKVIRPPEYLENHSIYDLRPLIQGTPKERRLHFEHESEDDDDEPEACYEFTAAAEFARRIPILHDVSWPTAKQLGVDESQLKALKTCLTKEFSIIQGPPGTGKTFIGLKVIEVLLQNFKVWTEDPKTHVEDKRPILVVCYTNHALDQFLEDVTKFCDKNLLRIGGKSNSKILKKYTMLSVRTKVKEEENVPRAIHDGLRAAFEDMKRLQAALETTVQKSEVIEKGILHEKQLRKHISGQHWHSLMELTDQADGRVCLMAEWLGFGKSTLFNYVEPEDHEAVEGEELGEDEEVEMEVEGDLEFVEEQRMMDDELDAFYYADPDGVVAGVGLLGLEESERDTEAVGGWEKAAKSKQKCKEQLRRQLKSCDAMKKEDAETVRHLWQLGYQERWRLYRYWIGKYRQEVNADIERQQELYSQAAARKQEGMDQVDLAIMRTATVIGMTTTGAAKYRSVLQEIQAMVVIVEQATEVLESHIITALSKGCQHLILIGDHKQLRPSPAVHALAKEMDFDISLFERMVKNDLHLECLQYQHRMRPEISHLIKLIYPELRDHENVLKYENIKGVSTNLFFINHNITEKEDIDSQSYTNKHEAEYIARLCNHLLLQGYTPSQITVLTTYTGQLVAFKDRNIMGKKTFEGVGITLIDNYEGDENDIILLSLVRSNKEGKLGFLGIQNRISVALSRAKQAMYVIGNFDMMMKKSEDWSRIIQVLTKNSMFGPQLVLQCSNHPEVTIPTQDAADFNKAPEGGCSRPCDHRLACGHKCPSACHVKNADHSLTKCSKPCEKRCTEGHKCRKICHEKCGGCKEKCKKHLPRCNHDQVVFCYEDPALVVCVSPCNFTLTCGHICGNTCGEAHTTKCKYEVQKTWPCGCTNIVQCQVDVTKTPCPKKCTALLMCDHPCSGTCGECFQGRIHTACLRSCEKSLVCGHTCKFPCAQECSPCQEGCQNYCIHNQCRQTCRDPCIPCNERCQWSCPHYKCQKACHELCDRPRCDQPCRRRLSCRHLCIGLCGEQCPKLCRQCNKDKVTEVFFGDEDEPDARFIQLEDCGHVLEVGGMDHWMDERDEPVEPEGICIQMKKCPKCCIVIRKHLRYGNIVKQTQKDIEAVKVLVLGERFQVNERCMALFDQLSLITFWPNKAKYDMVHELSRRNVTIAKVDLIENTLEFMQHLEKTRKHISTHLLDRPCGDKLANDCNLIEERLLRLRQRISDQQLNDFQMEVTRVAKATKLTIYLEQIVDAKLQDRIPAQVFNDLQITLSAITNGTKLTEENVSMVGKVVEDVKSYLPKSGLGVSDEEQVMTVKAKSMAQGQWRKCRNGHIYAIGDSGSAIVEGCCPECNAMIGGRNRTLTAGNSYAGDSFIKEKMAVLEKRMWQSRQGDIDLPKTNIRLPLGHWYKCPNGHPFSTCDSGRAMEEIRCPVCNATCKEFSSSCWGLTE